jgi:hypothetical protein
VPTFNLGASANYAILYEGGSSQTLQMTAVTTNTTGSGAGQGNGIGNIGIGGTGFGAVTGPSTINGRVDFSAANTGQFSSSNTTIAGGVNFNVAAVTSALSTVNAVNTTLGALPGTNLAVLGTMTVNASDGTFSASGTGYTNVRVFNVTSFTLNPGQTLTINGDPNGDSVVLNIPFSANVNGNIVLTGGLTPDNVIFNFVGGSNLDGGPSLGINNGAGQTNLAQGIFLDPNGSINLSQSNVFGRVFGGGDKQFQYANSNVTAPLGTVTPTLSTTPSPTTVTLTASSVTLTDSATLSGGLSPTGSITFTLFYNGGTTPVDTETVTVNGNGTYTTPTGFTLPNTSTVTGTYQWDTSYSGDANNNAVSDNNATNEQVTVNPANTGLITMPNPIAVTLGTTTQPVLKDVAMVVGAFNPTGTLTFTLFFNGGTTPLDTETVTINGNGTYTTPTGFALSGSGAVAGTYQWDTSYTGDGNNRPVTDNNSSNEQVTVSPASPTLTTTPSPTTVTLGAATPPILTDSATLGGGFNPTGTLTFTLFYNGGTTPVDTETVTVNGNGTYTTPTGFTLPGTGTITGTYQWDASYSGDNNNIAASDNNAANEQVTVNPANTGLITTPNPITVTLGTTTPPVLKDVALVLAGFNPTGTLTFTLFFNGGTTPLDTETVTINGNGTYTTPTGFALPGSGAVAGTYQWDTSYTGDGNNRPVTDNNSSNEQVTVSPASPTLTTTPSPTAVTLSAATPPILTDSATLGGGFSPTGTITFTLFYNGGTTPVDTEMVTVNGNGSYATPAGFTLPTTGTVTGTYQWDASYSGDNNNIAVSDNNAANEQVSVSAASPTLTTTPSPTTITLSAATPPILTDSVPLAGFNPTGTITFTLFYNGGTTPVDTETATVNGNGTYATPTGFTLPTTGTVTGTYQWDATYNGDGNNNTASDNNATGEQVTVSSAIPAISTTAMPSQGNVGVTLQDSAVLAGGFNETGTITFKLFAPGVDPTTGMAIDTETATVHGNGTYSTTTGFVSNAPGVWHWVAVYSGDTNNQTISSGSLDEPVTIGGMATLNLTKVASASQVIIGNDVTYTLTVDNLGPNAATGVTVADPFPAGIALVGPFTPSQGTFNPATGVWNIGTLPNGGHATLLIVAEVLGLGPNVNTATVSSANLDPTTASATVTGLRPANLITKQFFFDSFMPPAGDPPGVGAAASVRSVPNPSLVNGGKANVLAAAASPALDSLFASLGNGGKLQSAPASTVDSSENAPVSSGATMSDVFGPAYGNTLGGPLDTAGLVASGQPLAGGGSNTSKASDTATQTLGGL